MARHFQQLPPTRIAFEVGSHSRWVSELLNDWGHEVILANPRNLRLISDSIRKSDRVDAHTLARLARIDPRLLSPIQQIYQFDKTIEHVAREKYPETGRLRQISGVGPVTSLQYVLTIGDPNRFAHSRDVGAYLGLTPRRRQSGDIDQQLRISKAGNRRLRSLLVQRAPLRAGH
jgi:transposase